MDKTCWRFPVDTPDGVLRLVRHTLEQRVQQAQAGQPGCIHIPLATPLFSRTVPGGHYHSHPELFVQLSGTSRMQLTSGLLRVTAGELLLIPRGVAHQELADSTNAPFRNLVFMHGHGRLHYHAAVAGTQHKARITMPRITAHGDCLHAYGSRLYGYLNEVAEFVAAGNPVNHPVVHGLLLTHLALVLSLLKQGGKVRRNQESALVARARNLVREQLANARLCVQYLAEQLGCTPDYLSLRFHRETGVKLAAHINQERCHMARYLLRTTRRNIAEITDLCGYADPAYFSRVFSRQEGVSPRMFRQQLQNAAYGVGN